MPGIDNGSGQGRGRPVLPRAEAAGPVSHNCETCPENEAASRNSAAARGQRPVTASGGAVHSAHAGAFGSWSATPESPALEPVVRRLYSTARRWRQRGCVSMPRLFGTDGIRGQANCYPITPEVALELGKAIAYVFEAQGLGRKRAVIGKDTRLSGYMLETALTSGLVSMGMDVFLVGPVPTPSRFVSVPCVSCGPQYCAAASSTNTKSTVNTKGATNQIVFAVMDLFL